MSDASKFKVELMREAVDWAEKLDEFGAKATIRLDDKSQQTGTVAGVFLAAALSFLKPDSLSGIGPSLRIVASLLLFLGVCSLICAVATCLSVTWLRTVPIPVALEVMTEVAEDVIQHDEAEIDDDLKVRLFRGRLGIWQDVIKKRQALNKSKARRLKLAQTFLATGIVVVSCLLFAMIWAIVASTKIHGS